MLHPLLDVAQQSAGASLLPVVTVIGRYDDASGCAVVERRTLRLISARSF